MKPPAVYSQPNLLRFLCARMLIVLALQVQAVALGCFVYAQIGSAFSLGLINQPLQIIQPSPVSPAIGNAQHRPPLRRCRADRWRQIGALNFALDRCA